MLVAFGAPRILVLDGARWRISVEDCGPHTRRFDCASEWNLCVTLIINMGIHT
jgi:hypothetical protein